MIEGLLYQQQIPRESIADYGCYFMDLIAPAQNKANQLFTKQRVMDLFDDAVSQGIIKDNTIPINMTGWYRAFVNNPEELIKLSADKLNINLLTIMKYRREDYDPMSIPDDCNYCFIEYSTKWGSHFTIGNWFQTLGAVDIYNPWPGFKTNGIILYRYWSII